MKLNKTKNTIRNIIFGVITKIVQLILPFVIRTVFIYTLGIEYLGLNSLFTSILSVLSLSELGIGSAMVFSMYKPLADGDTDTICALMNLYRKCYRIIGLVITSIGILLLPFLQYLIHGKVPVGINIYIIYLITLFGTSITYFLFAYKNCILQVYQRNDIINKITVCLSLIQYTLQITILIFLKNYYCYLFVVPLISASNNIVIAFIVSRKYRQYTPIGKVPKSIIDNIKKRVYALLLYKIGGIVLNSVDNIVISACLGLTILAVYNNYYYIITAIFGFLSIISLSMLAGVANSIVTESVEKNYNDFKTFLFMDLWIVGWCAITLFCLYQPFMKLWVGVDYMFSDITVLLITILFYVWRIGDIVGVYKDGLGMWFEDRFRPFIGAVVNLVVNIILVNIIGINGVILSSIISILTITFPIAALTLFKNYFHISSKEFFFIQIKHFLIVLTGGICTYLLCNLVTINSFVGLFIRMLICIIVPNVIMLLFYHRSQQFGVAKIFVKNIIKRKSKL